MTEATQTIVEMLRDAALFYRSNRPSVDHEKRIPRTQEITERECDEIAEREEAAIAEIERLQSELNTALERVKVLEEAHRKIASTPYCGFAITSGLSRSDLEELVGTFWKEFETRVSISSAVLQSSGGK